MNVQREVFMATGTAKCGNSHKCRRHMFRGDGFQTSGVPPGSPRDPKPFFEALFTKPYLQQVVLSPHVYGPGVTRAKTNYFGTGKAAGRSSCPEVQTFRGSGAQGRVRTQNNRVTR